MAMEEHIYSNEHSQVNPISAMVTIWHHIIISFKVLLQKGFIVAWISWMKCIGEGLTEGKGIF